MSIDDVELAGTGFEEEAEEEFEETDDTLYFFCGLLRKDENERLSFFENCTKTTKYWVSKPDHPSAVKLLSAHLPTVVRLSVNAPFRDVRENAATLLKELTVS